MAPCLQDAQQPQAVVPAGSTVEYDIKLLRFVKVGGHTFYIVAAMQRSGRGGAPACLLACLPACSYANAGGVKGWVQEGCGRGCT